MRFQPRVTVSHVAVGLAMACVLAFTSAGTILAQSNPSGLSVWADTVSSTRGCTVDNVFPRGDLIVFRAEAMLNGVEDPSAQLVVHIDHGPTLKMAYGAHGKGAKAPHFWSAAWPLPLTQPTGIVNYTIVATDHGRTATWQQFQVPPSMLTIVPYTYTVNVTAQSVGKRLQVEAAVDQMVTQKNGSVEAQPMTKGQAVAELGLEGNVDSTGSLIAARRINLRYDAAKKAWVGSTFLGRLGHGLYVVVVSAQDNVPTPNTGTGQSLALNL